ncbi:uncharacterized protein GBIM_01172 [Gryllus bimaculatus]|nr:uncharacterized protein GBIM_01172 [Gryllus bimaculatus]
MDSTVWAGCDQIWFVILVSLVLVAIGAIVFVFFFHWVDLVIDHELPLSESSMTFQWWRKPPVNPVMRVYVYNVTNADEFLNNGSKPIVEELGPYVYV